MEEVWQSIPCSEEEMCLLFIPQVVEQGTQMTPVGEVVTTHVGRLSMLAKVNETGVQVDFFFVLFAQCTAGLLRVPVFMVDSSSKQSFER